MIKFEKQDYRNQKRDIISFCTNCHEVSGSQFTKCPVCNSKVTKKQIRSYTHNVNEFSAPVINITRAELINHFIPRADVQRLTDEDIIKLARYVEIRLMNKFERHIYKIIKENIKYLINNQE